MLYSKIMLSSVDPSLKLIERGVNRSCLLSAWTAGQYTPGVIIYPFLTPYYVEKATLNAVVLVWYLLNLD
ncbi:MAG: hypothetical protein PVI94_21925, partial [Desulfobacterales bacterium]